MEHRLYHETASPAWLVAFRIHQPWAAGRAERTAIKALVERIDATIADPGWLPSKWRLPTDDCLSKHTILLGNGEQAVAFTEYAVDRRPAQRAGLHREDVFGPAEQAGSRRGPKSVHARGISDHCHHRCRQRGYRPAGCAHAGELRHSVVAGAAPLPPPKYDGSALRPQRIGRVDLQFVGTRVQRIRAARYQDHERRRSSPMLTIPECVTPLRIQMPKPLSQFIPVRDPKRQLIEADAALIESTGLRSPVVSHDCYDDTCRVHQGPSLGGLATCAIHAHQTRTSCHQAADRSQSQTVRSTCEIPPTHPRARSSRSRRASHRPAFAMPL